MIVLTLCSSQCHNIKGLKNNKSVQIQKNNVEDFLDVSKEGMTLNEVESEDFLSEKDKRKIEILEKFI